MKETSRKAISPRGGSGNALGFAGDLISDWTSSNSPSRSAAPAAWATSPHTSLRLPTDAAANTA